MYGIYIYIIFIYSTYRYIGTRVLQSDLFLIVSTPALACIPPKSFLKTCWGATTLSSILQRAHLHGSSSRGMPRDFWYECERFSTFRERNGMQTLPVMISERMAISTRKSSRPWRMQASDLMRWTAMVTHMSAMRSIMLPLIKLTQLVFSRSLKCIETLESGPWRRVGSSAHLQRQARRQKTKGTSSDFVITRWTRSTSCVS